MILRCWLGSSNSGLNFGNYRGHLRISLPPDNKNQMRLVKVRRHSLNIRLHCWKTQRYC
ncbi:SHSP domain-containing protein [Caenorhabditis elegans]|uniref:SHSP domain-containing protein n=2 Tax=Caenorhabditis elegans TaxID=6239 RepID=A0A061AKR0_CAEEL|nr:SHSP domain-containing protein [Caenorhabditis elegans]CDR32676.1 SHSP domain-containing protein [Caenorhabditis elegans]|eukprot:NP_001293911.1 Uncharacterized protein CELE_ZK897.10 [Caenorhabditis elegans]